MDLETARRREKAYHERVRDGDEPLPRVDVEEARRLFITPTWESGFDRYNDQRLDFHRRIAADGGVAGREVLDYGCGDGFWALYLSLLGARRVIGFDVAESGLRRGMRRVVAQDAAGAVQLVCADATRLPFASQSFDLVIGHGVIHHVFKYPGIFAEVHRVLRSGGRAYFLENLADNPLFRLWWWWKGEVEQGDVPLFGAALRRETRQFRHVEIVGSDVIHALTTFLFRRPLSRWRRAALRATHSADQALFRLLPAARHWGACSILILEK